MDVKKCAPYKLIILNGQIRQLKKLLHHLYQLIIQILLQTQKATVLAKEIYQNCYQMLNADSLVKSLDCLDLLAAENGVQVSKQF